MNKSSILKKIFFCIVAASCMFAGAQTSTGSSADMANRRTALRYLQLAKNYASKSDWQKAFDTASKGNAYDPSVADLWYLMALSSLNQGVKRRIVMDYVKSSMDDGTQWVDYNRNSARIFYADLLCSSGKPVEAMEMLDSKPFIVSADAEFIRAKALYQTGTAESIGKARSKIDITRRIYPSDLRFPHLFFEYEYRQLYKKSASGDSYVYVEPAQEVRKIADAFISKVPEYDKVDSTLEIFAAVFSEGEKAVRLLKAFNARNLKNVHYAMAAMKAGLISENDALDYFTGFLNDEGVELYELECFASSLTDDAVIQRFGEYLNSYGSYVYCDTNNTLEYNLRVKYDRGRPSVIAYDRDNDGFDEWSANCDFGVPQNAYFEQFQRTVYYGEYPYPVKIVYENVPGYPEGPVTFSLMEGDFKVPLFEIEPDKVIKPVDFFIVNKATLADAGIQMFEYNDVIPSVTSVEMNSFENDSASVKFSLLNGRPFSADYFENGRLYAHAQFIEEAGEIVRNVDKDGDGVFEIVEIYARNDGSIIISDQDMEAMTKNIWGIPMDDSVLYLRMIQIDTNLDTKPDFTEEYQTLGGRITSWDTDGDEQWDFRYVRFPQKSGEPLMEEADCFVDDAVYGTVPVNIVSMNGEPVQVMFGKENIKILKGEKESFYWLRESGKAGEEDIVFGMLNIMEQGKVIQTEEDGFYIKAIRVGERIFAWKNEKSPDHMTDIDVDVSEKVEDEYSVIGEENGGNK